MRIWSACFLFFCFSALFSHAKDTLRSNEVLKYNENLVSAGGVFELGFFQDSAFGSWFVGIWFKNDVSKRAVWVASRENPLESTGTLQVRSDGNLILIDRRQVPEIVNSDRLATNGNTSAKLLDSGNLVLIQEEEVIWQTFDHPTDTYLPGMKLGWFGLKTNHPRLQILVSWVSPQTPVRGAYTWAVNSTNGKMIIWRRDVAFMDIGSWDGDNLKFFFKNSSNSFNFSYFSSENEMYYTFNTVGGYDFSWLVLSPAGNIDEYTMSNGKISSVIHSLCEESETKNSKVCSAESPLKCKDGDLFSKLNGSIPASMAVNGSINMGFSNCELMCNSNCSCIAFVFLESCYLYYGSKDDILNMVQEGDGVIYMRSTPNQKGNGGKRRLRVILLSSLIPLAMPVLVYLCWYLLRRNHNCIVLSINQSKKNEYLRGNAEATLLGQARNNETNIDIGAAIELELVRENDKELPLCSFSTIEIAIDHFAAENKLGEGGFGPVYKGKLPQGQEIAVKRLSKRSGQGVKEFRNEVTLISKLQHRNLVRLLGCCIQDEEYMLIYEYMPNRSLDAFIFDSTKGTLLDWKSRVSIIEGIAQGLLYLHRYSRLRIIHRDLKASNILLDTVMNPRISDFGLARIFGENETRAKTSKIAGTYGYMSPEYAMAGLFSEKSDVFSFGIIVLEVLSGQRNISIFEQDLSLNLIGYAWKLWEEGRSTELVDSTISDSSLADEILRLVQLGLLCVQDRAADRPNMSDVISMIKNEAMVRPQPKQPGFLAELCLLNADSSQSKGEEHSKNDITTSEITAR